MKANELRIGNYVNVPNKNQSPFRIDAFEYLSDDFGKLVMNSGYNTHPTTWYLTNIEPIPLTEEWLLKFGFKRDNNEEYDDTLWSMGIFEILESFDKEFIYPILVQYGNPYDYKSGVVIKYVHQLQNLYFALTGEELTINTEQP